MSSTVSARSPPFLAGLRRRNPVTCSVNPSRRCVSIAGILFLLPLNSNANAANSLDKYVKRKKLEPLEAYVPAVLLSQDQFKDLERALEAEQPKYDASRSLLRSGPAASLRVNIRAVAQYANECGKGKVASDAVDQCLRALEDLDSLLLRATRKDPAASATSMKGKITLAIGALDNLLQTVPSNILDKGKAIADAYRTPIYEEEETTQLQIPDSQIQKLESILS